LIEDFWEQKLCHFCTTEEQDDFVDGLRPCLSRENGYKCKHLDNKRCSELGIDCNPITIFSAGGFGLAVDLFDTAICISGRDHNGLQTASILPHIEKIVPYSQDQFWSLAKTYIERIRVKESLRLSRNTNG